MQKHYAILFLNFLQECTYVHCVQIFETYKDILCHLNLIVIPTDIIKS